MKKPLQIKITKQSSIPLVDVGKVFTVQGTSENEDGTMVYWIHHAGNHFAIEENMCEVVQEVEP